MSLWNGWKAKPPQGTPLDPDHPSNVNLTSCIVFNEGSGVPIDVANPSFKPTFSGSPTWASGPYGPHLSVSTSNYLVVPSRGVDWVVNVPLTLRMLFYPTVYGGSGFATIVDSTNRDLSVFLGATGNGSLLAEGANGGGSSPALGLTIGSWWDFVITSVNTSATAATATYYINGKPFSPTNGFTSMVSHLDALAFGGNTSSGGAGASMFLALVQCWNRVLTANEIASLYGNPWQVFASPLPFWWGTQGVLADPIGIASNTMAMSLP